MDVRIGLSISFQLAIQYVEIPIGCVVCVQGAAKMIKETMDKKFGATWHAVVGMGFGFEIAYDCKNLLYLFFGGNTAICLWKCA